MSDVFGADNVLWVEGRTEEACFPVIWGSAPTPNERVTATVILGVRQTGDHGVALTKLICERQPAEFAQIVALIREAIGRAG